MNATPLSFAVVITAAIPCGAAAALAAQRFEGVERRPPMLASCAVMAGLFAWASTVMPSPALLAATCALAWTLLLLTTVDLLALRLPDPVTLPLAAAGLALAWWMPGRDLLGHAIGSGAGYAAFALIAWAFKRWRGYEGLGLGDAKLAAAAGAWLGWQALPSVVLIACAAGIAWSLAAAALHRRPASGELIPFGAPLCAAIWIVWLYGPLRLFEG